VLIFIFFKWFNRSPDRNTPNNKKSITSPASGKIIDIIENNKKILSFMKDGVVNNVEIPQIMEKPYKAIIIEMNLKDIHVQRSPIAGELIYQKHISGKFKNAVLSKYNRTLAEENEKTISFFMNEENVVVGVIQVAGLLARRIQSFNPVGTYFEKGEKFGRIIFGSQVVLILPFNTKIEKKIKDTLIDGESILATIKK
jgi:phosphatidylserine decarboxylase